MTGATGRQFASERRDGGVLPVHFSLLLAKRAVLAATSGGQNEETEPESLPGGWSEIPPVVDKKQLARLRKLLSGSSFSYFIYCYLLDVEFHLEEILRARAAGDYSRLARKANILVSTAADVGAMRASATARRLDEACRAGNYRQTRPLISALSQSCTESEMELRGFLVRRVGHKGSA